MKTSAVFLSCLYSVSAFASEITDIDCDRGRTQPGLYTVSYDSLAHILYVACAEAIYSINITQSGEQVVLFSNGITVQLGEAFSLKKSMQSILYPVKEDVLTGQEIP